MAMRSNIKDKSTACLPKGVDDEDNDDGIRLPNAWQHQSHRRGNTLFLGIHFGKFCIHKLNV